MIHYQYVLYCSVFYAQNAQDVHKLLRDINSKACENKNALQWDAYHPLVDRISACTTRGGVSAQGEGCVCLGGTGVSAQGVGVCIPACIEADTPLHVDRQTPVKT